MNILALETATESCSVALLRGDDLFERSEIAPRRHAELALPMADAVLGEAGLTRADLHGIAVGRGPGSFTGVRLAVSMAQGLALALDLPVVTVSSLAALALEAPHDGAPVVALIDARMGEIYVATFERGEGGELTLVGEETVCTPERWQPDIDLTSCHVVGTGWGTYGDALAEKWGAPRSAEAECYPQARHVARQAALRFAAGDTLAPEQALPVYLRDKVALTIAERAEAKAKA
ncbi:tRNA (adenosine(37)-N6)-threonylcarbamoyltransferase complex dimerization subunit type 1 TsaB [Oleiagrimonas sp. MCCC 1A03011]|uniref:tRNA (adenosine(37)-N6)-threonylcarbamoyltransferase complex dimerization subunit type 1 TsaB n=1 Tax=Oleiagrimonas sp. MCCC 1A03011 TaxID=1926883 RepID=UPI000DC30DF8|nr:tRNA (adenosine(37)-N6)-threonylcarbamoyltransferase complex dimerization subunit type 1 TsaB [Oleiagrimonas sp. MCCC 1A03011]RAP56292.1 tRNA (adenosine(37)-N6)-threonylcarbamoyltransferase complex dimerization subunit type 1 TsaB [Oleiagrimonas sp. MCCC 1A03011]